MSSNKNLQEERQNKIGIQAATISFGFFSLTNHNMPLQQHYGCETIINVVEWAGKD